MSDTFNHEADAWDDALFGRTADGSGEGGLFAGRPRNRDISEGTVQPRCARCGSYNVRWRQQAGRWVLFSTTPGVEHRCEVKPLGALPEDE